MILQLLPRILCVFAPAAAIVAVACLIVREKKNKTAQLLYGAVSADKEEACIILDKKTRIPRYISPSTCSLFGLAYDTIDADITSLFWCMSKDDARSFKSIISEWDGKSELDYEFDFINIDTQKQHSGRVRIAVFFNNYIIVRIKEISKEVEQRRELLSEMERVKSEEKQKSNFFSTMSHEIRTPMNGILGMLALAKNNVNNPDAVLDYIDKAHGLSQFLLSIINDILDLSKIESGKIVLEHERFDLMEIHTKLSELFRPTAEGKNIEFTAVKEGMTVRYVCGDSLRLMQILTNLLSNAMKYTANGGKVLLMFRQMNIAEGKVHMQFRVKDNGKGMNPEFLNRIFKPFEQESASTTRQYGGTGLGMTIADNLVKLMGGHIVVDTNIGKGSEFAVYIPFEIAPGDQSFEEDACLRDTAEIDAEISLDGMCILMAEDNAINAEIAVELFKSEGAKLEIAENGKIALEKVKNCEDGYYDIIFMDIQMPEMDGWTAAREIRKLDREYTRKVPIFALSANAFTEDKQRSIEVGMNDHISKPIDFEELKKVLARHMGK